MEIMASDCSLSKVRKDRVLAVEEVMSDLFLGERGWDIVATIQMGCYKGLK